MSEWEKIVSLLSKMIESIPQGSTPPAWVLRILYELRDAAYDIVHSMFRYPPVENPSEWKNRRYWQVLAAVFNLPGILSINPKVSTSIRFVAS